LEAGVGIGPRSLDFLQLLELYYQELANYSSKIRAYFYYSRTDSFTDTLSGARTRNKLNAGLQKPVW